MWRLRKDQQFLNGNEMNNRTVTKWPQNSGYEMAWLRKDHISSAQTATVQMATRAKTLKTWVDSANHSGPSGSKKQKKDIV